MYDGSKVAITLTNIFGLMWFTHNSDKIVQSWLLMLKAYFSSSSSSGLGLGLLCHPRFFPFLASQLGSQSAVDCTLASSLSHWCPFPWHCGRDLAHPHWPELCNSGFHGDSLLQHPLRVRFKYLPLPSSSSVETGLLIWPAALRTEVGLLPPKIIL